MKAADLQLRSVQVRFLPPDGQEERRSLEDAAEVAFENCGTWKATPDLFVRWVDGSATVMEVKNPGRLNSAKDPRESPRPKPVSIVVAVVAAMLVTVIVVSISWMPPADAATDQTNLSP
ncbi:hypothetical protein [Nonomuraea insulae]|uniref:VRR-NUC domain-containing protein n=1 Tax=Nonomuraea insulae TaxID=1616787 RepID=A0ABW1CH20_9ACTN